MTGGFGPITDREHVLGDAEPEDHDSVRDIRDRLWPREVPTRIIHAV